MEACCGGRRLVTDDIDPNGCVSKIIGKLLGGLVAGFAIALHGPVTAGRAVRWPRLLQWLLQWQAVVVVSVSPQMG